MTGIAYTPWTDTEQYATCLAYCIMQQAQDNGIRFNKSAIRRELIGTDEAPGPLHARSNGSVDSAAGQATDLQTAVLATV